MLLMSPDQMQNYFQPKAKKGFMKFVDCLEYRFGFGLILILEKWAHFMTNTYEILILIEPCAEFIHCQTINKKMAEKGNRNEKEN